MNVTLDNVRDKFELNGWERHRIERCIRAYSRDISFSVFFSRLWNAICHIFGKSDWQVAKRILEDHAQTVIQKYSFYQVHRFYLEKSLLAEFLLRFLTTRESINMRQHQYYISREYFNLDSLNKLSFEEMVARAIDGNGITLPQLSKFLTINALQKEKDAFAKDTDSFKEYLENDPRIQNIKNLRSITDAVNSQMSKQSEEAPQQNKDPFDFANELLDEANKVISGASEILNDEVCRKKPVTELYIWWHNLKVFHEGFNSSVKTLSIRMTSVS